ncbi:PAS domain S-box-containing protein/diguanylate cyclase (GGDEF)-like protein [Halopolyspora algeriensis]|nr:diguanylate cyclase [Halopolyspora algeriensis]TQM53309.1 PAS domain S-box-containing protein/diguanylate cyclase (GGDEF)-like protein [Halopolyspora algeriensis]
MWPTTAANDHFTADVGRRFCLSCERILWRRSHPVVLRGEEGGVLEGRSWESICDQAAGPVTLLDPQGRYLYVNPAFCRLVGYSSEELLRRGRELLTFPGDHANDRESVGELFTSETGQKSLEKRFVCFDGSVIRVFVFLSVIKDADGQPEMLLVQVQEVVGRHGSEERQREVSLDDELAYPVHRHEEVDGRRMMDTHLVHLALHDPLTGLANRALLADRLAHRLTELPRNGGAVAVIMADLDGLKPINDHYGHLTGDHLLIATADELLGTVRTGDTVARLGGDEFVVVSDVDDLTAAEALRARIAQCLNTEVEVQGLRIALRASVGLAVTDDPAASTETLLHSADREMYARKRRRRRPGDRS